MPTGRLSQQVALALIFQSDALQIPPGVISAASVLCPEMESWPRWSLCPRTDIVHMADGRGKATKRVGLAQSQE